MHRKSFVPFILTLGLGLGTTSAASAGSFVEAQAVFTRTGVAPLAFVNAEKQFNDSTFGIASYAAITSNWGEAVVGPSWTPVPWAGVYLYVGFETAGLNRVADRYAIAPWIAKGPWAASITLETNRDAVSGKNPLGWFYDGSATYTLITWADVGLKSRSYVGTGPMVKIRLPGQVDVWTSWMFAPAFSTSDLDLTKYPLGTAQRTDGYDAGRFIAGVRINL